MKARGGARDSDIGPWNGGARKPKIYSREHRSEILDRTIHSTEDESLNPIELQLIEEIEKG